MTIDRKTQIWLKWSRRKVVENRRNGNFTIGLTMYLMIKKFSSSFYRSSNYISIFEISQYSIEYFLYIHVAFEVESVINFIFYSLCFLVIVWSKMKSEFIDHKTQNAYSARAMRLRWRDTNEISTSNSSEVMMLHTNHINSEFFRKFVMLFDPRQNSDSEFFGVMWWELWSSLFLSLLRIPRMFRVYWSVHGKIIQPFSHLIPSPFSLLVTCECSRLDLAYQNMK